MTRLLVIVTVVLGTLGGLAFLASRYLAWYPSQVELISSTSLPATQASPLPSGQSPVELTMEEFVTGLKVPWSLVFTSSNRLLFTERPGQVRAVVNGQLQPEPLVTFPETYSRSEAGLMGMTIDPGYSTNKYVYVSLAYQKNKQPVVKIVRMVDEGDRLTNPQTILDDIPAAPNHSGNRLKFGPDGKLYVTTGDAQQPDLAQDDFSLAGKILRLNPDGSIPTDNPANGSPVFSKGHRNPQGIDWHPVTGALYATEHGPSGNDGPGGGDEVNLIQAGQNYGWPLVSHERNRVGLTAPLLIYTPAVAPASAVFYRSTNMPQLTNTLLFGGLRGEGIYQVVFDPSNPAVIERHGKLAEVEVGRVRDVIEGPDGLIYFSTSNQDGRGSPRPHDDTIYRLVPKAIPNSP